MVKRVGYGSESVKLLKFTGCDASIKMVVDSRVPKMEEESQK